MKMVQVDRAMEMRRPLSSICRGTGTWSGGVMATSHDNHNEEEDGGYLYNESLKLPNICNTVRGIPKTFATRHGALLLFSDSYKIWRRQMSEAHVDEIDDEGIAQQLKTLKELRRLVLSFGLDDDTIIKGISSILHDDDSFVQVRPGFSPSRYMSSAVRLWDPKVVDKYLENDGINGSLVQKYFELLLPDVTVNGIVLKDTLLGSKPSKYMPGKLPKLKVEKHTEINLSEMESHKMKLNKKPNVMILPKIDFNEAANSPHFIDSSNSSNVKRFKGKLADPNFKRFWNNYENLSYDEKADLLFRMLSSRNQDEPSDDDEYHTHEEKNLSGKQSVFPDLKTNYFHVNPVCCKQKEHRNPLELPPINMPITPKKQTPNCISKMNTDIKAHSAKLSASGYIPCNFVSAEGIENPKFVYKPSKLTSNGIAVAPEMLTNKHKSKYHKNGDFVIQGTALAHKNENMTFNIDGPDGRPDSSPSSLISSLYFNREASNKLPSTYAVSGSDYFNITRPSAKSYANLTSKSLLHLPKNHNGTVVTSESFSTDESKKDDANLKINGHSILVDSDTFVDFKYSTNMKTSSSSYVTDSSRESPNMEMEGESNNDCRKNNRKYSVDSRESTSEESTSGESTIDDETYVDSARGFTHANRSSDMSSRSSSFNKKKDRSVSNSSHSNQECLQSHQKNDDDPTRIGKGLGISSQYSLPVAGMKKKISSSSDNPDETSNLNTEISNAEDGTGVPVSYGMLSSDGNALDNSDDILDGCHNNELNNESSITTIDSALLPAAAVDSSTNITVPLTGYTSHVICLPGQEEEQDEVLSDFAEHTSEVQSISTAALENKEVLPTDMDSLNEVGVPSKDTTQEEDVSGIPVLPEITSDMKNTSATVFENNDLAMNGDEEEEKLTANHTALDDTDSSSVEFVHTEARKQMAEDSLVDDKEQLELDSHGEVDGSHSSKSSRSTLRRSSMDSWDENLQDKSDVKSRKSTSGGSMKDRLTVIIQEVLCRPGSGINLDEDLNAAEEAFKAEVLKDSQLNKEAVQLTKGEEQVVPTILAPALPKPAKPPPKVVAPLTEHSKEKKTASNESIKAENRAEKYSKVDVARTNDESVKQLDVESVPGIPPANELVPEVEQSTEITDPLPEEKTIADVDVNSEPFRAGAPPEEKPSFLENTEQKRINKVNKKGAGKKKNVDKKNKDMKKVSKKERGPPTKELIRKVEEFEEKQNLEADLEPVPLPKSRKKRQSQAPSISNPMQAEEEEKAFKAVIQEAVGEKERSEKENLPPLQREASRDIDILKEAGDEKPHIISAVENEKEKETKALAKRLAREKSAAARRAAVENKRIILEEKKRKEKEEKLRETELYILRAEEEENRKEELRLQMEEELQRQEEERVNVLQLEKEKQKREELERRRREEEPERLKKKKIAEEEAYRKKMELIAAERQMEVEFKKAQEEMAKAIEADMAEKERILMEQMAEEERTLYEQQKILEEELRKKEDEERFRLLEIKRKEQEERREIELEELFRLRAAKQLFTSSALKTNRLLDIQQQLSRAYTYSYFNLLPLIFYGATDHPTTPKKNDRKAPNLLDVLNKLKGNSDQ